MLVESSYCHVPLKIFHVESVWIIAISGENNAVYMFVQTVVLYIGEMCQSFILLERLRYCLMGIYSGHEESGFGETSELVPI